MTILKYINNLNYGPVLPFLKEPVELDFSPDQDLLLLTKVGGIDLLNCHNFPCLFVSRLEYLAVGALSKDGAFSIASF